MSGRFTDVALAVAALALSVLVFGTRGSVTTEERESRARNVFGVWRPEDISRLVLERGSHRVVLERQAKNDGTPRDDRDSEWWIAEPLRERAEPFAVHQLLSSLEVATWLERFGEEQGTAARGLDSPRISVRVDMNGINYRLLIGEKSPRPDAYYARIGGDGVAETVTGLVRREVVDDLGIAVDDLRSHELSPYGQGELVALRLTGKRGGVALERRPRGAWFFTKAQGGLRASRDRVERLFSALLDARLQRFVDAADARRRLASSDDTLKLVLTPRERRAPSLALELGAPCPVDAALVLVLRRSPAEVAGCVRKTLFDALKPPSKDWVDRTPFFAEPDEIEELVIEDGRRRLELARVEQGFSLRAPVKGKVELDAGNQRLDAMASLRGELLPKESMPPIELDARRRVTARAVSPLDAETVEETLLVGRSADGRLLLRREQDGALLALDAESARLFEADATLIRSLQVLELEPSRLLSVDVRGSDLHQTLRRTQSGAYELEAPEGFSRDGALTSRLVDTLRSLRAVRWVADEARGFGLDAPRIQVRLGIEDGDAGARQRELRVGSLTSGGAFASLDSDGVFVIESATLETLTTWLIDRSVFMLDTDALNRLELERGPQRVVLSRRGNQLVQSEGSPDLTPDQIRSVTAALADFYAEAALHVGPPDRREGFERPLLRVSAELTRPGGGARRVAFRVGAGDAWRNVSVYYARLDGGNASYAVARSRVTPLLGVFDR